MDTKLLILVLQVLNLLLTLSSIWLQRAHNKRNSEEK